MSLWLRVLERAELPPSISASEYIRRILAHHLNYEFPPASERAAAGNRIDGNRKEKPGPMPKNLCANEQW